MVPPPEVHHLLSQVSQFPVTGMSDLFHILEAILRLPVNRNLLELLAEYSFLAMFELSETEIPFLYEYLDAQYVDKHDL